MPIRRRIVDFINDFRRDNHNPFQLHFHEDASRHAQAHAEHCARIGRMAHTTLPMGHGFNTELVTHVPTNLSPEQRAKRAVEIWKHSKQGHREDLLNGEWHVAVGEKDGYTVIRLKVPPHKLRK